MPAHDIVIAFGTPPGDAQTKYPVAATAAWAAQVADAAWDQQLSVAASTAAWLAITASSTNDTSTGPSYNANVYQHGFEDQTWGEFKDASESTSPPTGWTLDTELPHDGSYGIWQSGGAGTYFFYYAWPTTYTKLYVGFWMRLSTDFAFNPSDQTKVIRYQQGNIPGPNAGSFVWDHSSSAPASGTLKHIWEDAAPDKDYFVSADITADEFVGTWHWLEVYQDISGWPNIVAKAWLDGVLKMNREDTSTSTEPPAWGGIQFDGSSQIALGKDYYDVISIGTVQIRSA